MYDFHVFLYERLGHWSSNRWEWIVLGVGIAGLLWRFMAKRTKNTLDDRAGVIFDLAEAEARNMRNRAMKREYDEKQ